MEKIKEFLEVPAVKTYGYGDSSSYCYYSGYGCGSGSGCDSGEGLGFGSGSSCGSGYGSSYGFGYGYGDGDILYFGISEYNNLKVYIIDDIPTIITSVHNNTAKGYIVNNDLTLTKCYIAKGNNKFAHEDTLKKAVEDLHNKIFAESRVISFDIPLLSW